MRSLNKVMLIGNLTADPEHRMTDKGHDVATFTIATNRSWKTDGGESKEETEFHSIVAWNKLAKLCTDLLKKGMAVYVDGRLQTSKWDTKDGQKRSKTEIVIDDMIIITKKGNPMADSIDEAMQEAYEANGGS